MRMQYLYRIILISLCSFIISSLLYKPLHQTKKNKTLISGYYYTKERGVRGTDATVKVTYCCLPVGYTVVIDWLTRAE